MTPHAYGEDTHRKALRQAFLGGGSNPPGLDKDGLAVMTVAPPAADEHDKTSEIPNR
jgi:hypothetical protein